jgi:hypothetical protein
MKLWWAGLEPESGHGGEGNYPQRYFIILLLTRLSFSPDQK